MSDTQTTRTELVPIDLISVINPRVRNQKSFDAIVKSIAELGIKRPITVAKRDESTGIKYELVCGQGRLEAFKALGETEIPAIIVHASSEDCLVMSLVENLARRHHKSLDLLRDIQRLKEHGYSEREITVKTQLSIKYVQGVIRLLESKEHRLLRAVESGKIPVSVAVDIAEADDTGVQNILRQAYEDNVLRGTRLMVAKRIAQARQQHGKGQAPSDQKPRRSMSVEGLLKAYQNDVEKKQILLRKASATRTELMFLIQALKRLLVDENFITLLRAEALISIPKTISKRLASQSERN